MNGKRGFFALWLLVLVASGWGCSASRKTTGARVLPQLDEEVAFRQMIRNQIQADWFSARIRLAYADSQQSVKASGTLHMKSDSLIWLNIRKLGFEVARVKITPDSVFVIDRLNNQFVAEDLGYLDRTFQVPVNFSMLQALMLGNPVLFRIDNIVPNPTTNGFLLEAPDDEVAGEYRLMNPDLLLVEMILREVQTNRRLKVEMEEYEALPDEQKFSYFRKINLKENVKTLLDLEVQFSQVEVNQPKELRFVIPERYTRVR
jgi:hypothetical protein